MDKLEFMTEDVDESTKTEDFREFRKSTGRASTIIRNTKKSVGYPGYRKDADDNRFCRCNFSMMNLEESDIKDLRAFFGSRIGPVRSVAVVMYHVLSPEDRQIEALTWLRRRSLGNFISYSWLAHPVMFLVGDLAIRHAGEYGVKRVDYDTFLERSGFQTPDLALK